MFFWIAGSPEITRVQGLSGGQDGFHWNNPHPRAQCQDGFQWNNARPRALSTSPILQGEARAKGSRPSPPIVSLILSPLFIKLTNHPRPPGIKAQGPVSTTPRPAPYKSNRRRQVSQDESQSVTANDRVLFHEMLPTIAGQPNATQNLDNPFPSFLSLQLVRACVR